MKFEFSWLDYLDEKGNSMRKFLEATDDCEREKLEDFLKGNSMVDEFEDEDDFGTEETGEVKKQDDSEKNNSEIKETVVSEDCNETDDEKPILVGLSDSDDSDDVEVATKSNELDDEDSDDSDDEILTTSDEKISNSSESESELVIVKDDDVGSDNKESNDTESNTKESNNIKETNTVSPKKYVLDMSFTLDKDAASKFDNTTNHADIIKILSKIGCTKDKVSITIRGEVEDNLSSIISCFELEPKDAGKFALKMGISSGKTKRTQAPKKEKIVKNSDGNTTGAAWKDKIINEVGKELFDKITNEGPFKPKDLEGLKPKFKNAIYIMYGIMGNKQYQAETYAANYKKITPGLWGPINNSVKKSTGSVEKQQNEEQQSSQCQQNEKLLAAMNELLPQIKKTPLRPVEIEGLKKRQKKALFMLYKIPNGTYEEMLSAYKKAIKAGVKPKIPSDL